MCRSRCTGLIPVRRGYLRHGCRRRSGCYDYDSAGPSPITPKAGAGTEQPRAGGCAATKD